MFWRNKQQSARTDPNLVFDTSDRGPSPFFHGRKAELAAFQSVCKNARLSSGGTIFLIQGAPGAGKTALLHECSEQALAEQVPWRTADISSLMLHNPAALADRLGVPYAIKTSEHSGTATDVGVSVGLAGSFQHTQGQQSEKAGSVVELVLREAAGTGGLILVLDEVQNLEGEVGVGSPERYIVQRCLNQIHTGKIGAPVILLAGGLGTSQDVLERFGISRFMGEGLLLLGSLDDRSTKSVIRDWLVEFGGAPDDHEHLPQWIETLAIETHGWPQHIQCYALAAAQWLLDNGHAPLPQVPVDVLSKGQAKRESYYDGRIHGLSLDGTVALAKLLRKRQEHPLFTTSEIKGAFGNLPPPEDPESAFQLLLHKGVLAEFPNKRYSVPVPSMIDWLVRKFADAPL